MVVGTPKSPLRYPGGKSRAVKHILSLIPSDLDAICSPFFGGGSVELACAAKGVRVHGYDGFEPLVNFWQLLLTDASSLAKLVSKHHPLSKEKFYTLQKNYSSISDRMRQAAAFFTLNRCSFSGTTLSGGMSPGHQRFTESSINRLAEFTVGDINVELADFTLSIPKNNDVFLYVDPPYANGSKLYGKQGNMHDSFDHLALAELLWGREEWILSYNDCPTVRELYKGYEVIEVEWAYGMNNSRTSNEILILSKDMAVL